MKTYVKYGVALIAGYLIVKNREGVKPFILAGASGTSKVTKTFQGR